MSVLTDEQAEAAWKMWENGATYAAIGRKFGVDPKTVQRRLDPDWAEQRCEQINRSRRSEKANAEPLPPRFVASRVRDDAAVLMAQIPADTRNLTQRCFGDPVFERSALARIRQEKRTI